MPTHEQMRATARSPISPPSGNSPRCPPAATKHILRRARRKEKCERGGDKLWLRGSRARILDTSDHTGHTHMHSARCIDCRHAKIRQSYGPRSCTGWPISAPSWAWVPHPHRPHCPSIAPHAAPAVHIHPAAWSRSTHLQERRATAHVSTHKNIRNLRRARAIAA